jgi:hypothetical protein
MGERGGTWAGKRVQADGSYAQTGARDVPQTCELYHTEGATSGYEEGDAYNRCPLKVQPQRPCPMGGSGLQRDSCCVGPFDSASPR